MIRWILVTLAIVAVLASGAQAETPYDIISCFSGDYTLLTASKEFTVTHWDIKGVSRSNIENGPFHNWTLHIVGSHKIVAGEINTRYIGKYVSPEGDFIIGEGKRTGTEGSWQFIHGTGKWKGITGGGTNKTIPFKPVKEGTTQGCTLATGTYELPE